MTDNKIDFEDCGAFVRLGGYRFAKAHLVCWVPSAAAYHEDCDYATLWITTSAAHPEEPYIEFSRITNVAEVVEALDEAMRGAR